MNYSQLINYMKLQKYTDDQIKRTIIFLDNQEYYQVTKEINQKQIEEVQQINETITNNVLEFKKEEVIKVEQEVLQETLSNIILDLKPEELKMKFLESNIDRANAYDNIDFLMKVIPETSTKYEALKEVKSELELKPILSINSKQSQDYSLNLYNKELNIDISKPKENLNIDISKPKENLNIDISKPKENLNIDISKPKENLNIDISKPKEDLNIDISKPKEDLNINFSKPTQKFDTSSLEPKIITPIDYSNVEIKSKDYSSFTNQKNDIPMDLSKPKTIIVESPKEQPVISNPIEIKTIDLPKPKILNNDEKFGEYIERTFANIENKKYTLSGLDELVKDLNTYKEKETNPQKKEIFEVLETSAFSQFVVSIDEYNKNFNKEIIDNVKTQINQNNKEINIKEDIKKYEEEHKNDSKVKDSSIFSFTLIGALLDNLNATYITQEEYNEKQKKHSKMLQEKDQDVKKFEENLEHKKDEEKDKNFKSLGYFSAISTLMYYQNLALNVTNKSLNDLQNDYFDKMNSGIFTEKEQGIFNIGQLNLFTSIATSFVDGLSGTDKINMEKVLKDLSNNTKDLNSWDKAHKSAGDILIGLNKYGLLDKFLENPENKIAYMSMMQSRSQMTQTNLTKDITTLTNQINEMKTKGFNIEKETKELEEMQERLKIIKSNNEQFEKLNNIKKDLDGSNPQDTQLINELTNKYREISNISETNKEILKVNETVSNVLDKGKTFNSLNNTTNNNNKCLIEESDTNVNLKSSFKDFNSEKNMIEYPEHFGRDM